ncbi:MAG: archease [Candidatus Coatesbacteria bacterium]|nr:MAG: archease [Candidatus Coatesbacteria bacterium]
MGTIRYLAHTADAGVEIVAASREELFVLGARAVYQLVLDYDAVESRVERRLEVAGPDLAELFHEWLAELLYWLDAERLVFRKFGFVFAEDDRRLEATAEGEELDVDRHRPHGEVKNVTYADYAVERDENGDFVARVIFDL